MQAEYERQIRILQAENARLYERSIKAEAQRDAAYDKITEMRRETYQLAVELEEEKERIKTDSSDQQRFREFLSSFLRPVHQEKENP